MPEISVVMGILCKSEKLPLLKRAVNSILSQSFTDFELLICDDGSDEAVKRYLNEIARNDSRIILVRSGSLFTLPEKLNRCLEKSSGNYIARMDDDDFSHETRFINQIEFLRNNPDIDFVGCNVNLCENGKTISKRCFPEFPTVRDFYFNQPFIHPALMFRRKALIEVNGYSLEKRCLFCEDYDLLLRMYAAGMKGANLPMILFDYTLSETAKGKKKYKYRINEARTRYVRFKQLRCLPKAIPYVVKPLIVGLIPYRILCRIKGIKG